MTIKPVVKPPRMKNIAVRLPVEIVEQVRQFVQSNENLTDSDIYRQIIVDFFSSEGLQPVNSEGEKAS